MKSYQALHEADSMPRSRHVGAPVLSQGLRALPTAHQQEAHEGNYPCMLPPRDSRCGLDVVHSVLYQPVKHLQMGRGQLR